MIVLSHFQAEEILKEKGISPSVDISPDLGLSIAEVALDDEVTFPNGESLCWDVITEIAANENNCYAIENGRAVKIQSFSEAFNRVYTLYPTESAPTMLVSGIPMHRIKGTDPCRDTQEKIKAFGKIGGAILDTTTGLGYTAILVAAQAENVTTVELDPTAQEIARDAPEYERARKLYLTRHPQAEMLFGFGDFALFELRILGARFVAGFGAAFDVRPDEIDEALEGLIPQSPL